MEKKEKKSDLEGLLNSLIEKGWKPFGKRDKLYAVEDGIYIFGRIASDWNTYDLRQVTSKESGLWQFVCENMLINKKWFYGDEYCIAEHCEYTPKYYKFRLIVSSLKDESELEDFLLDNINTDGTTK